MGYRLLAFHPLRIITWNICVFFEGTKNVIKACKEQGVSRLIYTSTIDVVIGYDDIIDGNEDSLIPDKWLFPGYPDTKYRAECLVLKADDTKTASGIAIYI